MIAIIAILAAILFPVFARARENARKSSCASNLKQIGLGMIQYAQDYDEVMPPQRFQAVAGNSATRVYFAWQVSTAPYLKSTQIFTCPSDSGAVGANQVRLSYTYSTKVGTNDAGLNGRTLSAIPLPSADANGCRCHRR